MIEFTSAPGELTVPEAAVVDGGVYEFALDYANISRTIACMVKTSEPPEGSEWKWELHPVYPVGEPNDWKMVDPTHPLYIKADEVRGIRQVCLSCGSSHFVQFPTRIQCYDCAENLDV